MVLDPISIELEVRAAGYDDTDIWMSGSLVIAINRLRPYSEDEIVVTDSLLASLVHDGDFQIFSCVCGMPDCAARSKGVRVRHGQDIVEWTDLDRARSWRLQRTRIDRDLERLRDDVDMFKRFFAVKGIRYVGVGYDWVPRVP